MISSFNEQLKTGKLSCVIAVKQGIQAIREAIEPRFALSISGVLC